MMRWGFLLFVPILLLANPSGLDVVSGVASLERTSHELRVTVGERAELNWQEFSIGPGEATRFIQPSAESYVLNRVVGGSQSTIHGLLEANGHLLLINPAGILVGPNGTIRTAGFIASTLDVLNFDPKEMHFSGPGGAVVNCGRIEAPGSEVVLIGEMVKNYGTISADGVRLGAGREIVLMQAGEQRLIIQPSLGERLDGTAIDQQGRIEAIQAELRAEPNLYALAINHGGNVDALSTVEVDGRIFLVADGGRIEASGNLMAPAGRVHVVGDQILLSGDATVDVSGAHGGGTALIGGDYHRGNSEIPTASYLLVEEGVSIHADALEQGDGGRAILWGSNVCGCFGTVTAQGGPKGGDGGLIEVSGKGWYSIAGARLSAASPMGIGGLLSFDPVNVTVSNNPDSGITTFPPPEYVFDGSAGSWNINKTTLENFLASSSVEINTSSISGTDPGLAGDVDVQVNVGWTSDNALIVRADGTMTVDGVTVQNTSSTSQLTTAIDIVADTLNVGSATATTAGGVVAENNNIRIVAGTVNITGTMTAGSFSRINTPTSGNISVTTSGSLNISTPSLGSAQLDCNGDIDLDIGNGLTVVAGGSGAIAHLESVGGHISAILRAGNLLIDGGSNAAATAQPEAAFSANTITLSLPTGDHKIQGGTVGSAALYSQGDLTITSTESNVNLSVLAGQANPSLGLTSQAVLETEGGGNLSIDVSSLTVKSNVPLNPGGGSFANVQSTGDLAIVLDDFLTIQPGVAGGSTSSVRTTAGGDISITGNQFDVTIGGVSGDGSLITTTNGGSIRVGSLGAPAGSVTIESMPASTSAAPLSGITTPAGGSIALVATGDLSITAGVNPTNVAGDAGIFVGAAMGDVAVRCANLTIQGGSNTGTGSATAGIETLVGDIAVASGGSTMVTAGEQAAYIFGRNLAMAVKGDVTVTAGSTNQQAFLQGLQSVNIAVTTGRLRVMGGSNPAATNGAGAEIVCSVSGDLNISLPAGEHGCFGGAAGSAIIQNFGTGNLNIAGREAGCNFSIIGGQASATTGSEAQVNTFGGSIAIALSRLTLGAQNPLAGGAYTGGSSALIQSQGDIAIALTDALVMAPIVAQGEATLIQTVAGGSIAIAGPQFDVQIGSALTNTGNLIATRAGGSIALGTTSGPARNVSFLSAPFVPGSGTHTPLAALQTATGGDISLVAVGEVSMIAGANPTNTPGDAGLFAAYNSGMGSISLVAGNIAIQGGSNTGTGSATAGVATGLATGSTGTGDIDMTGFGSLTIAGSVVSAGSNQAQVAALNGGSITGVFFDNVGLDGAVGDARIYTPSGSIDLIGGSMGLANPTAYIESDGGGAINLRTRSDITVSDGAFLSLVGPESLTALAGRNFIFDGASFAQVTGGGSMRLACDNAFPSFPLIGPGEFRLAMTNQLNASGDVLIYTARREQNSIASGQTINGAVYIPGPLFMNSDTEQWQVYYPGGTLPAGPFKIFYKNGPIPTPAFYQEVAAIIGEFFDQMNWFVDIVDRPTFPYRYPISLFEVRSS